MQQLAWFFETSGSHQLMRIAGHPILVLFLLYASSHLFIVFRLALRKGGMLKAPLARLTEPLPPALLLVPTLLRVSRELEGLQAAVQSIVRNGYPGGLVVCIAIDDGGRAPALCDALERWVDGLPLPGDTRVLVIRCRDRVGKAMAMELAIENIKARVQRGELARFPPLFFNVDADSELGPRALEHLAARLVTPGRWSGQRPMIVTSNVCVRRDQLWQGFRHCFTVPGQLALQVAREYAMSIGLGRYNVRVLPVTTVSGALYCTWSELHLQAPAWGGLLRALRWRDLVTWWLGGKPPAMHQPGVRPLPESTTGPGDDTWITWLAMGARWRNGKVHVGLPATPAAALWEAVQGYFFRPLAYAPEAKVFTSTPTTAGALFKQRLRWNASRGWLLQRLGLSIFFNWRVSVPVIVELGVIGGVHVVILASVLGAPFASRPTSWLALALVAQGVYVAMHTFSTVLAIIHREDWRGQWPLLLAVPLALPYHLVFNVIPTIVGFFRDLLLFGLNTGFAPEQTLARAGVGRVALTYRLRRALRLTARGLLHGDVPVGWFWLGWSETRWTPGGYTGWTGQSRSQATAAAHLGPTIGKSEGPGQQLAPGQR